MSPSSFGSHRVRLHTQSNALGSSDCKCNDTAVVTRPRCICKLISYRMFCLMPPPSPQLRAENTPKLKAESRRLTFDVCVMVVVVLLFAIPFYSSIRCCIIRSRILRHVIWLKTKCRTTANAKPSRRTSARSSAQSRHPKFS